MGDTNYKTHQTVAPYLRAVRKHDMPYETDVLGKSITVLPNVMSPKYDWSSEFFVKNMPGQKGKSFLEIGSGCGIVSVFAGYQNAKNIVAVDINKNAIRNTKENLEKHEISNHVTYYSDVFSNVSGTYDTIAFNAPYHGNSPSDILEYGVSDPDYRALKIFLGNASEYLNKNGQVLLGFSDTGDIDLLNDLIIKNRLMVKNRFEETRNGWTAYLYVLEPMEFKNKYQKYIYDDDYFWFKRYKKIINSGTVLKVGHGLGYVSYFMKLHGIDFVVIDVREDGDSVFGDDVIVYDGETIPFESGVFDTVICSYTLHHIKENEKMFSEITRVANRRVIVIEEIYTNFLSRLFMVFNCWLVNKKAHQRVDVHWDSYFNMDRCIKLFEKFNLNIDGKISRNRTAFTVYMFNASKKHSMDGV